MNSNLSTNTASGSATGNPRNKIALKPGYSLVGWIRLGNSGEDLTGLGKGKTMQVSHSELAKHNTPTDCWMAVRGKVYNVTRYLEYHPGGQDQLMRGAGRDATSLYDEAHGWVNIDQLLAKCFIGPLRNTAMLSLKDFSSNLDIRSRLSPPSSSLMKLPCILSASSETLSNKRPSELPEKQEVEVIPRFDWIQKTTELSIYFYTKSFCNPAISTENVCDKESEIKIYVSNTVNFYKFFFLKTLKWPCRVKINQETGKIEIVFEKVVPELWSNFGTFERTRIRDETVYSEFKIISKCFFNHDSFELILRPNNQKSLIVPIGYHLNFRLSLLDQNIIRSYTPIPIKYTKETIGLPTDISFLIKTYSNGKFSQHLSQKSINGIVYASQPKGSLDLNRTRNHTKFTILAAGSGITPMVSIIDLLLERNNARVEIIKLFYFNKTAADIWLFKQLNDIEENDGRLSITHILSEPETCWSGETGRITENIAEKISSSQSTFVFICGPSQFNEITMQYLKECQSEIHLFHG